ncbi:MAG: hypothetical protein LBT55_00910 [Clostridiaceae bacterium]|jgi:uncharacterized membrane protein YgaE (UPF0421/DUF939 family)|nr:hypothetical protein [Clostridiaceae bacterium]
MITLSGVPSALTEYWYVYDIILAVIIVAAIFVLHFLRKRTKLKSARAIRKNALSTLKRVLTAKHSASAKLSLIAAHNLLKSLEAAYAAHVKENEAYAGKLALDRIHELVVRIDETNDTPTDLPAMRSAAEGYIADLSDLNLD